MRKAFPTTITVLATLALIGLLYLQMSWIHNAVLVQKAKYANDIELAYRGIKIGLQDAVAHQMGFNPEVLDWDGDDPATSDYLWSLVSHLPANEVSQIIRDQLDHNNIHLPFEFMINSVLPWKLTTSSGFRGDMLNESYTRPLTYDGSYTFYLYIVQPKNYILRRTWWMIGISLLFTAIIITAFYITIRTVYRQKKIAEMKTDFINNMTHEFKTPMATISLAVDALGYNKVRESPEQLNYYTNIIKEENERMHKQVEKVLETARTDKDNLHINPVLIDAHEVIELASESISVRMQDEQGTIDQILKAKKHEIYADEVHFSNIITNLLENAIKYSNPPRHIVVTTQSSSKGLTIKIKDNGIGMDRETASHIFEKFYRAHTGDLHNVKGFGLGLSYVKSVVDAHFAKIKVVSSPGKGTTFILDFAFLPKGFKNKINHAE